MKILFSSECAKAASAQIRETVEKRKNISFHGHVQGRHNSLESKLWKSEVSGENFLRHLMTLSIRFLT
jgi:hypothetical protein